jgi:DNA repair protein RadC
MSISSADTGKLLAAIQSSVRAEAGKHLPPLLKRWRYTQSSDHAAAPLRPETLRFLARYGLLNTGADDARQAADFEALLRRLSRESGEAAGIVASWMRLFAAGEYGVMPEGICGAEPRCGKCPLKESCRHLISGGRDARSFGESLAQNLLVSSGRRTTDLRAADLLAYLLHGEKTGAPDIARAEALLKTCGGLRGAFNASLATLRQSGLPEGAISRLQAAAEICRSWAEERGARGQSFTCGKDFYDFFHLRLRDLRQEVFIVAMLDQKNCLIDDVQVSAGTLSETLVHPREVFAHAIQARAAAVAVLHNHPSGDPTPSAADKNITNRLQAVAKLVGIRFIDHVVIGDGAFVSFAEKGLLE